MGCETTGNGVTCVTGTPKEEEVEEIILRSFPMLVTDTKSLFQEAERESRQKSTTTKLTCIIFKEQEIENKEKFLKIPKKENKTPYLPRNKD